MPIIAGQITGSVLSGSLSYTFLSNIPSGIVSGAAQVAPLLPAGTVSSSGQVDYNSITNKLSGVVSSSTQVQPLLPGGTVSASNQVDITATTNYSTFSSSLATVDVGQTTRIDNLASLTSSYAINSTIQGQLAGVVSSSTQVQPLLPGGTVSSSGQVSITATTGYSTFSSSIATKNDTQDVSISALNAATSSYAINATIQGQLAGVVSSSAQVKPLLPGGTVTSSAQYPGWVTASSQIDYNSITNKLSGVVSSSAQVQPLLPAGTLSSSTQVNAILDADGVFSSSAQVVVQNTTGIGALATTGSNTFTANQTITGSLFISQNLTVLGSSSISYISQSTLNIGTNKITVNTDSPSVRFGGLDVIDSGSSPQRSGSLYFDSVNDQWISIHQNTAGGITSSVLLVGPATFNNIGGETYPTQNRVLKGAGLEHVTDSQITDNGVTVSITNGLSVGTNLTASQADITTLRATSITSSVSGALTGTFPYSGITGLPTLFSASSQVDYNNITNKLSGVVSSSTQVQPLLPGGTVSASGQVSITATTGYSTFSSSIATKNDTQDVSINALNAATSSYAVNATIQGQLAGVASSSAQVKAYLPGGSVSSSAQYPGWVTASSQIDYNSIQNKLSGVISSSTQFNALTNTYATSASYVTSTIDLGAPTVVNTTNGAGLVLRGTGNSQTAQLRIVANGGGWLDNINTAYFQISSSTGNNASFMGGTYGADAAFDRLQFNAKYLQVTNNIFGTTPVPSYVFQVLNLTSSTVPVFSIVGNSPQTANYLDITTSGSTAGNILSVRGNGLVNIGSNLSVGTSITASIVSASSVTGSFQGNGSQLTNISNSALPGGIVSSSTQLPAGTVSSSAQYPGWVTASSQIDYNNITNKLSGVVSSSAQVKPLLPGGTVTSSAQYPGWVTASSQVDITATTGYSTFSSSLATVDVGQTTRIDNLASQTSSYAINATIQGQLAGVVSSSTQVKPLLPGGTVTSSAQYPGWVTASSQIDYNSITNKLSGVVSSSTQIVPLLPAGTISASSQVALSGITGTTFATANFTFPQNLTVAGTLTAEQFITEFISASVIYESGSSKFGDTNDDVMSVTGSIRVLGGNISGSFIGLVSQSAQIDYNSIQNKLSGVVSSSAQVQPLLPGGTVSSSAQYPGWVTSSAQIVWSSVNYNGGIVSSSAQVQPLLPGGTVSSSGQVDYNSITNKLSGVYSSSTQAVAAIAGQTIAPTTVNATNITASALTANQAVFTNASDGFVSNAITGTGNVVMSTSPTLVTPILGTPTSVTLTNATGLPVSTGISGLGTGVATFLATPSSANLASAVTDETGTGALVFAGSPTLTGTVTADKMVLSGSQFAGIVSGSGTQYRLVVPVGTNLYAT